MPSKRKVLLSIITAIVFIIVAIYYACTPKTTQVGFSPEQPIPFSHKLHVGDLKLSCISCHPYATYSSHAGVSDLRSCLACHKQLRADSRPRTLSPLFAQIAGNSNSSQSSPDTSLSNTPGTSSQSYSSPAFPSSFGQLPALAWSRVHKVPDYATFHHGAHVNRGIGCQTCHGRVDTMERIRVTEAMSMSWCLNCHRDPTPHLRPLEEIYTMDYSAENYLRSHPLKTPTPSPITNQQEFGSFLKNQWSIRPRTDCSTCHH